MKDYSNVVYDEKEKPFTSYPQQLIAHLFDTSKMRKG